VLEVRGPIIIGFSPTPLGLLTLLFKMVNSPLCFVLFFLYIVPILPSLSGFPCLPRLHCVCRLRFTIFNFQYRTQSDVCFYFRSLLIPFLPRRPLRFSFLVRMIVPWDEIEVETPLLSLPSVSSGSLIPPRSLCFFASLLLLHCVFLLLRWKNTQIPPDDTLSRILVTLEFMTIFLVYRHAKSFISTSIGLL